MVQTDEERKAKKKAASEKYYQSEKGKATRKALGEK
tara:strand:+ start:454 stop:561 length:108 start_codon:yes stop_codon:yes gene_type:complete